MEESLKHFLFAQVVLISSIKSISNSISLKLYGNWIRYKAVQKFTRWFLFISSYFAFLLKQTFNFSFFFLL